ncbi:MAG: hypothetical protein RI568_02795 [Natronomonas sp.]|jgi:hypothetical protein|uniref:HVO_0234 family beta-propeller protein n=1 Tax=Natronomonas sp. TaxID=2184060 RepID=UPI0028700ADD|nr:hypothetical protein [Natronomonas sp.]MDR9429617.1 hypothetical protein [Natronomonas sp.]
MSDEDISLTEKRVYAGGDGATAAFVASAIGLARVAVSDDIVGEFSLDHRGDTTAVAADGGHLAIGTPEDVFIGTDDGFYGIDFGAATAVGYRDGLVASGGERVARYDGGWETVAEIDGVRAIDDGMVAAESGVYRLDGTHVGLDDVRDVSGSGTPLAATGDGLYALANGWVRALDGAFRCVSSDGERAHAATRETLYERSDDGEWTAVDLPVDGAVVDVAYGGDGTYAVTEAGVFLADVGDGWRHRSIGLSGVSGMAIV